MVRTVMGVEDRAEMEEPAKEKEWEISPFMEKSQESSLGIWPKSKLLDLLKESALQ